MAKTFYTDGTGSQQTLTPSQNEKVAVYQTLADAEADSANLEAGQIVATPDTGDENAQPVDEVTDGNMHAVTSNAVFDTYAVITAGSTTLTGKPPISLGSVIKIMFTSAISGSNTTTGMSISYNGTSYPVKVGKNGSLANFVASEISSGVYRYLQAYTTLELAFDGTQFIIIGNPVVLSSADYTIYADGHSNKFESFELNSNSNYLTTKIYVSKQNRIATLTYTGDIRAGRTPANSTFITLPDKLKPLLNSVRILIRCDTEPNITYASNRYSLILNADGTIKNPYEFNYTNLANFQFTITYITKE